MSLPAFQKFYEEHRAPVHRYLAASLTAVEAEDCFQETFLAALRAYPELNGDSNLRAWIFTIAHNKVIDAYRARNRRPLPVENVPETPIESEPIVEPGLWKLVDKLPPKQRTSVLLRYVGDLPYAEVARAMGGTEEAARQNVRQGLKRLRKVWRS